MTMSAYPGGPPIGAIVADQNRRRAESDADASRARDEHDRVASLILSTRAEEADMEPVVTWDWRDDVVPRADDQWTWHEIDLDCTRAVTLVASVRVASLSRTGAHQFAAGKCWIYESVLSWALIDSISGAWWSVYASGELSRRKLADTVRLSTPMGSKLQLSLKLWARSVQVAEDDLEGLAHSSLDRQVPVDELPADGLAARNVDVALLLRRF